MIAINDYFIGLYQPFTKTLQVLSPTSSPFTLIYTMTSQERVIGNVSTDASHRAIESKCFTKALLHELELRYIVHGWFRTAIPGIRKLMCVFFLEKINGSKNEGRFDLMLEFFA